MIKTVGILASLIILVLLTLPIPMPGDDGSYNTISRLYWCANPTACAHERGHKLDQALGWPSQSKEYLYAVQVYMVAQIQSGNPSPVAMKIISHWGSKYRPFVNEKAELYATIYALADGKIESIPPALQEYYR